MSNEKGRRNRVQGAWGGGGGSARKQKAHQRQAPPQNFVYDPPVKPRTIMDNKDFLSTIREFRLKTAKSVTEFAFNNNRVRWLSSVRDVAAGCKGIVYWMSRDQRVQDNWALLYAQRMALRNRIPLHVCFCLVPKFLEATIRQYGFMLRGLEQVEEECKQLNIPFHLLKGHAKDVLPKFVSENQLGGVVADFSPLRVPSQWVQDVKKALPNNIAYCQVDAHNIVPCWETSKGLELRAYIIRSKLMNQMPNFLTEFPPVIEHPHTTDMSYQDTDWDGARASLQINMDVPEVSWAVPGTTAGIKELETFCKERLHIYKTLRNDPTVNAQSNLSPWFHFGHVSVQRAILMTQLWNDSLRGDVDKYIDEAVIWRELAENFCAYNEHYDSYKGAEDWAKESLDSHRGDYKKYVYTKQEFEEAKTHDTLWNASQIQMVKEGKMHGFNRMYWGKKILEWSASPEEALKTAIYLNDKYSLDGRDPNGYAGIMWAICGIHDRSFGDRAIYGGIRYMSYEGSKKKFDVKAYEKRYVSLD